MIRLTALASDHGFTFTLEQNGELLFTTGNRADLAEHMLGLGIDDPLELIGTAERWGVVDIREEPNPRLEKRVRQSRPRDPTKVPFPAQRTRSTCSCAP